MPDQIISASSPDDGFALVAGITTELVREAQVRHTLAPTASAAVGRLMTGTALLGSALKGRERISLQISGDGPLRSIVADAWYESENTLGVRGYAKVPQAEIGLNRRGKFDVAGALGEGSLQVTKSYEIGQPYVGIVPLLTGEVAEDIASYLANSQQIPSVVALGVLANPDGIRAAGGIIGQVMPGADESAIGSLEARALAMPMITTLISKGAGARDLLQALAGDIQLKHHRTIEVHFGCRCTKNKVEVALLGLGKDELAKMAGERPQTEATCEFCKKIYVLTSEELSGLVSRLEKA